MKRIIFILFLFPTSVFSQEKATLYLKNGFVSEGIILSMGKNSIQFEGVQSGEDLKAFEVYFVSIYLLINDRNEILIHNPEYRDAFESHGIVSPIAPPIAPNNEKSSKQDFSVTEFYYSIFGTMTEGRLISNDSLSIEFLRIDSLKQYAPRVILKSHIYMVTNTGGDTIFINLEKEKEYENRRKRLIEKNILIKSETAAKTKQVLTSSYIPQGNQISLQKEKMFNPDGEIGTAFIDLGAIQQFGDDPKTRNIFALVGVPLSEKATLFGGFQRASTSFGNESVGVNAVTVKIRFYISK